MNETEHYDGLINEWIYSGEKIKEYGGIYWIYSGNGKYYITKRKAKELDKYYNEISGFALVGWIGILNATLHLTEIEMF